MGVSLDEETNEVIDNGNYFLGMIQLMTQKVGFQSITMPYVLGTRKYTR